ncbi:MAG: radical SAM protein [Candidatus Lokiarchaeota archaeon]|nr:radical SAM protein [Candidatus Lokiarchaeota archaeon]
MAIDKIRVSIGSASVLGLYESERFKDSPTTCYLMTYKEGHCTANCGFCPQARESESSIELLSRVSWPIFSFKEFLTKLNYLPPNKKFKRICIQTLNYFQNFQDLTEIIPQIKKNSEIPISVAIPPMSKEKLEQLRSFGVERIGIALDAATPEIFENIKGKKVKSSYNWETHLQNLKDALEIFPEGLVTTHLIVGLGETSKEILELISDLHKLKIKVSLFAFMPIKGTKLENLHRPKLITFRKIQLGRYLLINELKKLSDFTFNNNGDIIKFNLNKRDLWNIISNTDAFLTSGCPGCNRPYYTSRPSGPTYNYPRNLTNNEKEDVFESLINLVQKI